MTSLMSRLRSEPVRGVIYPLLTLILGILVTRGIITNDWLDLISVLAVALLGVPAVETARSKVTPVEPQGTQ